MHKRILCTFLGSVLLALPQHSAFAAPITAGDLVSIRVGDGTTVATGTALPVTLDEWSVTYTAGAPTGLSLVQSIPLPTGAAGTAPVSGNRYVGQGGTAAGEGGLTLSADGKFMTVVGYNSGKGDLTNGTGNTEARVVCLLNLATGTTDSTTALTDIGVGNAIRSGVTSDGTNIWVGNSANGVRFTTLGGSTSTALTGTGNERRVNIFNNQLYTSRMSGTIDGVATVGTGLPTSGTQTVTLLPGFPTATNSMYDYWFADANTLYTVDDRNSGTGGLEKWTFNGSTWSMAYSLLVTPSTTKGLKSLTGTVDGSGNVALFGATTDTTANFLYGFGDTLANTSAANVVSTKLVTASTDFTGGAVWNLRGVSMAPNVPEPTSIALVLPALLGMLGRRRLKA